MVLTDILHAAALWYNGTWFIWSVKPINGTEMRSSIAWRTASCHHVRRSCWTTQTREDEESTFFNSPMMLSADWWSVALRRIALYLPLTLCVDTTDESKPCWVCPTKGLKATTDGTPETIWVCPECPSQSALHADQIQDHYRVYHADLNYSSWTTKSDADRHMMLVTNSNSLVTVIFTIY